MSCGKNIKVDFKEMSVVLFCIHWCSPVGTVTSKTGSISPSLSVTNKLLEFVLKKFLKTREAVQGSVLQKEVHKNNRNNCFLTPPTPSVGSASCASSSSLFLLLS